MHYEHYLTFIKGDSVSIKSELEAMDAPKHIMEGAELIQAALDVGLRPPMAAVQYIQRWVGRQREQNRYGK